MRWLLGKKSPQEKRSASEAELLSAIAENKQAIDVLEKRHEHLDKKVQLLDAEARIHARNNNQHSALFALKRKKLYLKEIEQLCTARLTLDQQIQTLESAQSQQIAVQALAAGVSAQRKLNQNISVDRIDRIVDDMQEQQDHVAEVMQVFAQGYSTPDDAELMRELQSMELHQPVAAAPQRSPTLEEVVSMASAGGGWREAPTDEEQLESLIAGMQ
eukprot:Polyplicarium_translucidae@DN3004_c0_g1_i4.p1